jgi:hypothetical protein
MCVRSVVVVGLIESDGVISVDREVRGVNVVPLHDPFEDLGLVNGALFHEIDSLILHHHGVVHVVVQLHLQLILQLPCLVEELLIFNWLSEVLIVLSQQVELADVRPRVETIAHRVLSPYSHVLATSEEIELVDFLFKVFPIEDVGEPSDGVGTVEEH